MKQALSAAAQGLRTFVSDVADGFFEITHNGFALLGLATVFAVLALLARPDLRQSGEDQLMGWLEARRDALKVATAEPAADPVELEPTALERTTAASPLDLPKQQAAVAYWLSKKYRVAAEPLSALVAEAYQLGQHNKLDPTLILAIMAVESSFNPFAQSNVGAQGLMQVMTRVHGDKYEGAGGTLAAFDPLTNMRVGVKVLQECIERAGSLEGGLRFYVGAANLANDGGYAAKVMAERDRLSQVAHGRVLPLYPPTLRAERSTAAPAAAAAADAADTPAAQAKPESTPQAAQKVALLSP